jgi:acetyltransferase-like isoleucine patch superfamily enzyme/RimJ/RimL family protein N-acetyltransferase
MEKEHRQHHTSNYDLFMSGEYCNSLNPEVLEMISNTKACLARLDSTDLEDSERSGILRDMLGSIGQRSAVGRNFLCQCGKHIFIGDKSVINDNCTMMDENHIRIGNQVLIAPNVQFYTATHPINYNERFVENWNENSEELFFRTRSLPITVEDNVWIGGGSIILAGITIGKGSVIGAGSVVTKSIPANCVALGNPCRVIRYLKSDNKIQTIKSFKLRNWNRADVPALARHLNNKNIWDNCRDALPYPYTEKDAEQFISFVEGQSEQSNYCIEINHEAAGNISFIRGTDVERYNAELGYWLAEPYWNLGIMTEAIKQAVEDYLSHSDTVRIHAHVYENNLASMKVLEKAGFHKCGILRKACFKNGRFVDCHCYELLKR